MTTARNRPPKDVTVPPVGAPRKPIKKSGTAVRASRLATEPPPIVRARRVNLTPDDTVVEAFGKMIAKAVEQVLGNVDAVLDARNPDAVHQLRVGLRRVRSVLSLFRNQLGQDAKRLDRDVRLALKVLGDARDLDVFLTETLPLILQDHSGHLGLLELQSAAQQQKARAYEDVRDMFLSDWLESLFGRLAQPDVVRGLVVRKTRIALKGTAAKLLQRRHKKVLKSGRNFTNLSTAKRHDVRIALKKLRYACDYFQGLYPAATSRTYLKRLKSLQDDLGQLNDAAIATDLANRLAATQGDARDGADVIAQWYDGVLAERAPHMIAAWDDFERAEPFWLDP